MPDIRQMIQIAAAPAAVYPFTSTARGFAEWWAIDITEPDGSVELAFFRRSSVYRVRLVSSQPPHRAEWICETGKEWIGTHIVFELCAAGIGTALAFSHSGWHAETDYFTSCNTTWGELMFRLKAAAEGRNPGPLFLADGMAR